jgi:hypothetical protein
LFGSKSETNVQTKVLNKIQISILFFFHQSDTRGISGAEEFAIPALWEKANVKISYKKRRG